MGFQLLTVLPKSVLAFSKYTWALEVSLIGRDTSSHTDPMDAMRELTAKKFRDCPSDVIFWKRTIVAIFIGSLLQGSRLTTSTEASCRQVNHMRYRGQTHVQARGRIHISLSSCWRQNRWRQIKELNVSFVGDCRSLGQKIGSGRYREGGWRVSGFHWSLRPCSSLCGRASSLILLGLAFQILLKQSLGSFKLFRGGKLWATLDKVRPIWGYIPCFHIRDGCKIFVKKYDTGGARAPSWGWVSSQWTQREQESFQDKCQEVILVLISGSPQSGPEFLHPGCRPDNPKCAWYWDQKCFRPQRKVWGGTGHSYLDKSDCGTPPLISWHMAKLYPRWPLSNAAWSKVAWYMPPTSNI